MVSDINASLAKNQRKESAISHNANDTSSLFSTSTLEEFIINRRVTVTMLQVWQ